MASDIAKIGIIPLLYCFTFALASCNSMTGKNGMQNQPADRTAAAARAEANAAPHADTDLAGAADNAGAAADNAANVAAQVLHINSVNQYRGVATDANNTARAARAAYRRLAQDDEGLLAALVNAHNATNVIAAEIANRPNINPGLAVQLPDLEQHIANLHVGARRARTAGRAYLTSARVYRLIKEGLRSIIDDIEEVSHQ